MRLFRSSSVVVGFMLSLGVSSAAFADASTRQFGLGVGGLGLGLGTGVAQKTTALAQKGFGVKGAQKAIGGLGGLGGIGGIGGLGMGAGVWGGAISPFAVAAQKGAQKF